MVSQTIFMGEPGFKLDNDFLSAVILPRKGGKVVSLHERSSNFELLFQNPKGMFKEAETGSYFSDFEACGYDDAFPSIDKGIVNIGGRLVKYPDHGEIWSACFDSRIENETIQMLYHGKLLDYDYYKVFKLRDNQLQCYFRIVNTGSEDIPCIWTMHCLVQYHTEMRLIYPQGTEHVQNVFDSAIGKKESILDFPCDYQNGALYDFRRVPVDGAVKYYIAGKVSDGICGYDYPHANITARLLYDPKKLPYLGCWVTAGGYRGDKNCALEPTNGYYDSIETANRFKRCPILQPGEEWEFDIAIRLGKGF